MRALERIGPFAVVLVLLGGWATVLALNFPGHLSVDSVLQLHEGRFHVRETWGPAMYAWLLGVFDSISPGTKAYLAAATGLLFGAWLWLTRIAGRASILAAVVALALIATPNILIYQGIVWRDVLFANLGVAGFVSLAAAARAWDAGRRPWLTVALAALLLAVAALVRQNGPVLWVLGAIAVGWAAPARSFRGRLGWGAGWFVGTAAAAAVLSVLCLPQGPGLDTANARGLRLLQIYDLVGAVQREPGYPLPRLEAAAPKSVAILRSGAPGYYSPQRIDFLNQIPNVGNSFNAMKSEDIQAEWLKLVTTRPDLYLQIRFEVLRWVVDTPVIDACLPVHVGVEGPVEALADLKMTPRRSADDTRLYNYSTWFMDTPVLRHMTYVVIAGIVGLVLLIRRRPEDIGVAGLQFAALAFAASYFPISLACDYRYLYFVDLAAMTGVFYLALDPLGLFRRR